MTIREQLVLATANPGKVAELADLLGHRFEVIGRPGDLPETVEDGDTLEANAHKKATEVVVATGAAALADDTGLFVDALGGRPGVHTARFAGPEATSDENLAHLLGLLDGHEDRRAHFETVLVLVKPDGAAVVTRGRVDGTITTAASGRDGFGYDPVFVPDEGDGRTFAQMARAEKQAISHRGRALAALLARLDR